MAVIERTLSKEVIEAMNIERVKITAKKMDGLIEFLKNFPAGPIGDHLSDDEFVEYAMEWLSEEDLRKVDGHLHSCIDCATQMEVVVEKAESWRGTQGQQNIDDLKTRCRLSYALSLATDSLGELKLAAESIESREIWSWECDILRGHAVKEINGDWTFRFSSDGMDLLDKPILLHLGTITKRAVLTKVSRQEVGAKIVVPRHEQKSLDIKPTLSLK